MLEATRDELPLCFLLCKIKVLPLWRQFIYNDY